MADSVSFKDSAKRVLFNKGIDGGQANAVNFIILPRGTTAELAALPQRAGGIAYDTDLGEMVVNDGSGYVPAGGGGSGTVTEIDTGVGLTGGPITSSGTIDLADTSVTPGAYTSANITVDAQGRITSAANGSVGTLDNNSYLSGRNSADNSNIGIVKISTSDEIILGNFNNPGFTRVQGDQLLLQSLSNLRLDSNTGVTEFRDGTTTNPASLDLYGVGYSFVATLRPSSSMSEDVLLEFPSDNGTSGQLLSTDGNGVLSWALPSVSFPLLAPNGSMSAPSYAFSGSPDTGIYASGTSLGIVCDGTFIAGFHTTGGNRIAPEAANTTDVGSITEYFKITYTKNAFIQYGELRFYDADLSNYVSLYPDATIPTSYAMKLPIAQGAAGTVLQNDGAGNLSFSGMAIKMYSASSDPGSPVAGQVYYNTTSNKLKVYTGATWETITSA